MGAFAARLGATMFGAVVSPILVALLRASGKTETVGGNMSYELIGTDYEIIEGDDEFEGAIGADFIEGDDDDDVGADADDLFAELVSGSDFISGMGDSEIIGARRPRRRVRRRPSRQVTPAARQLAMRNAGMVVQKGLSSRRRNPLGFVPTSIGAGATVQVPSAPQNLFRPERLVIPSDIAFDFGVADVKVGNVSQLVQSAELPAAIFSEVSIDTNVTFDTAEVGNQVSVNMRNKSAGVIEFTAALLGTIAKR